MILVDYSNYRTGQAEWASKLMEIAEKGDEGRAREFGLSAGDAMKRVAEFLAHPVKPH